MYQQILNHVGKDKGHFTAKENRAQKLINNWAYLQRKFEGMIKRGNGTTFQARCAYAILLMMETGIRVGNEASAEGYVSTNKYSEYNGKVVQTFGLTTLQRKHIRCNGKLYLSFLGKKAVFNSLSTTNKLLKKYYYEIVDGKRKDELFLNLSHYELTKFVKKYVGRNYMPKDFRTAKVNLLFADNIQKPSELEFQRKSDVNGFLKSKIESVAGTMGHTSAICKRAYVSKIAFEWYKEQLLKQLK